MRPRLPDNLKAALPLAVALGLNDEQIARTFGAVDAKRVAGYRARIQLPNPRGWPIDAGTLGRHLAAGMTDGEIADRYDVRRRTVEVRRIAALGLYRDHDPRPVARRRVMTPADRRGRPAALSPIEAAVAALGSRAGQTADGGWMLDGRRVTVQQVLAAGGVQV